MAASTSRSSPTRRVALATCLAASGVLVLADPAAATTPDVLVVGDSLTFDASDEIHDAMAAVGFHDVAVVAFGGTDIAWATEQLRARPEHPIVVLASGTNNTPGGWSPGDRADADAAVQALRNRRCSTWVLPASNRHPHGRTVPDAEAAATVQGIRSALAGSGVHRTDWSTAAAERPDWHQADGVHHTATGQQAYAALLASDLRSVCGPHAASTPADPAPATHAVAYVDVVYRTFLDRPPSAGERAEWARRLTSGTPRSTLTRDDVRLAELLAASGELYERSR
jgi:lysophospholipase L1-like esterase